jgi:hypothetical protein
VSIPLWFSAACTCNQHYEHDDSDDSNDIHFSSSSPPIHDFYVPSCRTRAKSQEPPATLTSFWLFPLESIGISLNLWRHKKPGWHFEVRIPAKPDTTGSTCPEALAIGRSPRRASIPRSPGRPGSFDRSLSAASRARAWNSRHSKHRVQQPLCDCPENDFGPRGKTRLAAETARVASRRLTLERATPKVIVSDNGTETTS